jgi:hypothetical protein
MTRRENRYREREGRRGRYFCFVAPFENRVALGFESSVLLSTTPAC